MRYLTDDELCQSLCTRDPRHPLHTTLFDDEPAGEVNAPDCSCDACHYGLHRLADELIARRAAAGTAPSLGSQPA